MPDTMVMQCAICGKDFTARQKNQKYCSNACRKAAEVFQKKENYRNRAKPVVFYTKTCQICGKDFETLRNSQIYCSTACRKIANRAIIKSPVIVKTCVICGKEFETNKPDILTCSRECSYRHHLNICRRRNNPIEEVKICPVCGEEFKPYRNSQIYCSVKCRDFDRVFRRCRKHKTMRLEHKFKDEAYTEIHRDIFTALIRQIFHRGILRAKRKAQSKPLDDWIREADLCGLSYGLYRAAIEIFSKTFEELRAYHLRYYEEEHYENFWQNY